ncbi:MAG: hypothetical protein VW683_10020 [Betaproteobacteria bacterium]
MTEEEYEECCVRNWCFENSMRLNKFAKLDRIIEDARKIHRFVRGKRDGALVPIKKNGVS